MQDFGAYGRNAYEYNIKRLMKVAFCFVPWSCEMCKKFVAICLVLILKKGGEEF